jgi:type II secretory pathway component PulF
VIPGLVATLKTVLAGMLGVRAKADHERESASLNPLYVIIAGVVVVVLFVSTLVAIASFVVG